MVSIAADNTELLILEGEKENIERINSRTMDIVQVQLSITF